MYYIYIYVCWECALFILQKKHRLILAIERWDFSAQGAWDWQWERVGGWYKSGKVIHLHVPIKSLSYMFKSSGVAGGPRPKERTDSVAYSPLDHPVLLERSREQLNKT